MINKQNLWFLTLCSLILVLGVYYVTMPNELLLTNKTTESKDSKKSTAKKEKTTVSEVSTIEAMRVSLEEERSEEITTLQEQLTSDKMTAKEKNEAYEQLKYLNEIQGKEETLEKKLKEAYKLDCFVKVDNSNVTSVCVSSKHDSKLANNIMRTIQEQYNNKMYITVKFEKA
ncbi:MAG: SpoIIIAH-like family protein [Bacilli bacterium]|nr:SpoIIIAH-like family protein [Bacilli bacterium]